MRRIQRSCSTFFFILLSLGSAQAGVSLKGTGSFLAAPLLNEWIQAYHELHPDVKIKYETKNSLDGINQWLGRGAEFALTDSPLTAEENRKIKGWTAYHLPVAVEAVVITYNLPGVPSGIKLSPRALSGIFRGTVKKWNDPVITETNPGISFPALDILVVHREEESALHDLFPSYLSQLDPQWTLKREKEKKLKWPVGQNLKGNEKAVEKMRKWPGVIAALDYSFAAQNHLPMAELKNAAGDYVTPSAESMAAGMAEFPNLPEDLQVILGRSRLSQAYPLCTFTWLLVYQDQYRIHHDHPQAKALQDFLDWVLTDGQRLEEKVFFTPLPETYLIQVKEKVQSILN